MAATPDHIEIRPVEPFDVRLRVPGSKSLTNRALLLAALAEGTSTLAEPLWAEDTQRMHAALQSLGVQLQQDAHGRQVTVTGANGRLPQRDAELDLGNAGTAMRFLTAACCLPSNDDQGPDDAPPVRRLDGNARMHERPIGELVDALRELGAGIDYLEQVGFPPLSVRGTGLRGGELRLGPTASSQFISALLQVGPFCEEGLRLRFNGPVTSQPYVQMTIGLMRQFGARVDVDAAFTEVHVKPGRYQARDMTIEPDASSASYFLAAAALVPGSRCTIEDLGYESLQGDVGFAEMLEQMGAPVKMEAHRIEVRGPEEGLHGIDVSLNHMPDMAQTLAAIAIFANGPTTIRDVGNLRIKETDRMAAVQRELNKLGATVLIHGDDVRIEPPTEGEVQPATIDTYDDHRMAMSLAIVGLRAKGIVINDPACVDKTFPDFFDYLERLQPTAGAAE